MGYTMNSLLRFVCLAALCTTALASCQTAGRLINAPIDMGKRMFQAVGRSAGLVSEANSPGAIDTETLIARGKVVEHQGTYGAADQDEAPTSLAKR